MHPTSSSHSRSHVASVYQKWNWLSVIIAAASIAVFVQMQLSGPLVFNFTGDRLESWGAVVGTKAFNGEAWRFFSAILINTGLRQVVGNICLIFLVAPFLISAMGTVSTATIFLACGWVANTAAAMTNPNLVFVGASGAVFGLYGALISVFFAGRFRRHSITDQKQLKFAIWLSVPLSLMMSSIPDSMSIAAYLSGLVMGCLLGYSLTRNTLIYRYGLAVLSVMTAISMIFIVTTLMQGENAKVLDIFSAQFSDAPAIATTYDNVIHEFSRAIASP